MANAYCRWGILSTARINESVLPAFGHLENATVCAVASRDLQRASKYAEVHNIAESYGSYQELLDSSEIDCIYVSLPNSLHAAWVERALRAGKNVLCEKPLAPTESEANRLFDIAEENNVLLMEAFMYRHHPQTHEVRRLVLDGVVGQPQLVRLSFNFKTEDPLTDVRYRKDLAGGALLDVGCYCVNFCTYLFDSVPIQVSGWARMAPGGIDEGFCGQMHFDNGVFAIFDCSIYTPLDIGITVLGDEGHLHVPTPWYPHQPPRHILIESKGEKRTVDFQGEDSYQLEISNFSAAVIGEAMPLITREETTRNIATIERLAAAANISIQPSELLNGEELQ